MKLSLGKDFFGRPYDRLSPSSDQSPKWYCATCSMHKNLQRDLRTIKGEWDHLRGGASSELANQDQLQRAMLRLREMAAILNSAPAPSLLIVPHDITSLMQEIEHHRRPSQTSG
jgi:hypothetical protein